MDSETSTDIRANLERVQAVIAAACRRAGRSPDDVLLIAVSKTMPVERVKAAVEAGVAALGENRVQEAKDKIEALGHPVPWHLIGHLQTNKAKDAVQLFDCIQSVDRLDLAREIDRRARGRRPDGGRARRGQPRRGAAEGRRAARRAEGAARRHGGRSATCASAG